MAYGYKLLMAYQLLDWRPCLGRHASMPCPATAGSRAPGGAFDPCPGWPAGPFPEPGTPYG